MPDTDLDFVEAARAAASSWKSTSLDLPDAARLPAPYGGRGSYPFVLPPEHRWLNLLEPAREIGRTRFEAAGIRWHGDEDGPNPHLCSSQIQCLNALAPWVDDPAALERIFNDVLPIAEVLPFGASTPSGYDLNDHVVFEWQGGHDHLGEWSSKVVRGAHATSADAAIRYRAHGGHIEIALIEWKYLERYPHHGRLSGTAKYHDGRLHRYASTIGGPDGPVRFDLGFDYEDLFAEPIYQLARTQALAAAMEQAGEQDAQRVVVVYATPDANEPLRSSLGSPRFERYAQQHGLDLADAWLHALRQPDRFVSFRTGRLLADDLDMPAGFVERYAPLGADPTAGDLGASLSGWRTMNGRCSRCQMT